ncbi:MAG: DNA primase [Verrucomicrobia bacterium]|nr:DNA primase [Verrucomicrobiota bacterium]
MAGLIPDSTLDQIRAANDIVDIIGGYIPLKRAGANFTALCPFHREKTPSFNVNPHKQIFHCFGCHKGGDVFTFVKEYENIGFVDAVRRLADRAKISLELDNNPAAQESRHIKDHLLQIHDQITQRWQNCLANEAAGQLARDYLAKRGVSADAIKLFRIGAAPETWDDTVNWARSKDHDLATVEKAGLIIRKEETGNYYDRFRGRLMFPICDEQGRVIGFSGRVLTGDEKTAKYVNSPETPIFTKSKVFFGLDKSKRAILDAGYVIVCEGQLDLIACFTNGVQNIVAPQGTAFTDQHARIIKRYVDEVVLCFDSDNAGQNAAVRSLDSLLASGLAVRVAVVPQPHDPDSFIKENGGEAFRKLVEGAEGFFDYYLNRLCATHDVTSDKGRLAVSREMAEAVRKTGNNILVDKYAQKTALRIGVSPESMRTEFVKSAKTPPAPVLQSEDEESFESAEPAMPELPPPSATELWLARLVFKHDQAMEWLAAHLDPRWIQHPLVREAVSRRIAAHSKGTWRDTAAFLDELESPQTRSLVTETITDSREIPNVEQQFVDISLRLRNQFIDRQLAALTQRISQPDIGDAEKLDVLREQQTLKALKRQPLAPLV